MKRSLNILFGLVLLSVFSMKAQFSGGTGSETDPFIIKTRTDLETTLNEYNNKTGFYFKLANDLDVSDQHWTPIASANSSMPFKSVFDGAGHKIIGLTFDTIAAPKSSDSYIGLFGVLGSGAVIKNLHLENVSIYVATAEGNCYAAAIAGYVLAAGAEDILIQDCSVTNLNLENYAVANNYNGGIVGYLRIASGTGKNIINRCAVKGKIGGEGDRSGGIGGCLFSYSNRGGSIFITNCVANVEVSSTKTSGDTFLGGIAGTPYLAASNYDAITIDKCLAAGKVDGGVENTGSRVGGIIGRIYDRSGSTVNPITVTHNVAVSEALSNGNDYTHRIFGSSTSNGLRVVDGNLAYEGILVNGEVETGDDGTGVSGISKTRSELLKKATYEAIGWDFTNDWQINEGKSFPYLKWQTAPITSVKAVVPQTLIVASGSDGFLNLKGFVPNEQIDIYNSSGMKVYSVKAKGSELNVKLPVHEVYIISAGAQQIKVLH